MRDTLMRYALYIYVRRSKACVNSTCKTTYKYYVTVACGMACRHELTWLQNQDSNTDVQLPSRLIDFIGNATQSTAVDISYRYHLYYAGRRFIVSFFTDRRFAVLPLVTNDTTKLYIT